MDIQPNSFAHSWSNLLNIKWIMDMKAYVSKYLFSSEFKTEVYYYMESLDTEWKMKPDVCSKLYLFKLTTYMTPKVFLYLFL